MDGLAMYTVYENPSDYPGWFVVRRSVVTADGVVTMAPTLFARARTLKDCRAAIEDAHPEGLVCMHRSEGDEPQIVEVWL
jgi:hypothetical protein